MSDGELRRQLMEEAIREAEESVPEDLGIHPKVGAVLADREGNIIARAHRGESREGAHKGGHAEFILLEKARAAGCILKETTLFVTLEPCTERGPEKIPCAHRIASSGIKTVFIGMLDPNPFICGRGEIYLRRASLMEVERFPNELVKRIEKINSDFIDYYRSSLLPKTSLYIQTRISQTMCELLQRRGLDIDELPSEWDITIEDIINCCLSAPYAAELSDLPGMVRYARATAFDKKYLEYSYENDSRGLSDQWRQDVREVLTLMRADDYTLRHVLNVGIGNGLEGDKLFDQVEKLTIVDIAPNSLERAQKRLPLARAIVTEAENLSFLPTGSQDIYVSLRTYQSSYCDMSRAVREAYRVVRQGGVVLISIANGFIGEGSALIPGLLIPHSNVVDRDRPFLLAERVRQQLSRLRFEEIGVRTGFAEIYVFGRRAR